MEKSPHIASDWGRQSPILGDSAARPRQRLERLPARRDAELPQQALHVGANGVLRDEESLCDLVRGEMLVEEQKHFELSRRENRSDRIRNSRASSAARPHLLQQ